MRNARLNEAQAETKIAVRNINNFRYADGTTLMVENKEKLKSYLWRWKRREKKQAWNTTFKKKKKVMESGPITSW